MKAPTHRRTQNIWPSASGSSLQPPSSPPFSLLNVGPLPDQLTTGRAQASTIGKHSDVSVQQHYSATGASAAVVWATRTTNASCNTVQTPELEARLALVPTTTPPYPPLTTRCKLSAAMVLRSGRGRGEGKKLGCGASAVRRGHGGVGWGEVRVLRGWGARVAQLRKRPVPQPHAKGLDCKALPHGTVLPQCPPPPPPENGPQLTCQWASPGGVCCWPAVLWEVAWVVGL